jgi:long-subunit fatty acid transport protein
LLGAIEYAVYSAAPAPIADVGIDVHLGTTPGLRPALQFDLRFHDTVSPRVGAELRSPSDGDAAWRWAVRAGYARVPSPVPDQPGFTTFLDSTRHEVALGGGYHLGKIAGVDLAIDVAGQVHVLTARAEEKPSASLPYARFESSGTIVHGAATLEATWR